MEQEHLRLKQDRIGLSKELVQKERRFRQYERLYKKNLLACEDYLQAEEDYEAALGQLAVVDERIEQDDLFRSSQLQSLDENIRNMKKSLALVRGWKT
jgi:HlyD family secretion protein